MRNSRFSGPPARRSGGRPFSSGGGRSFNGQRRGNKQSTFINPQRYVSKAVTPQAEVEFVPVHQFSDFALSGPLQRNIAARNYVAPSAIQDGAIPVILEGRDVIGLANTGTGKTAAFVLPIIEKLLKSQGRNGPEVLIMAPTRELALQIDEQFRAFAKNLRLYSALCVGGMNINRQISDIRRRPQVIIGTPGRLKDLINKEVLRLNQVHTLVLDEADQMLDMGFINDIRFIIAKLPAAKQSLCFSATITPGIQQLLDGLLRDPVTVSVRTAETSQYVEQDIVRFDSKEHRMEILHELLNKPEFDKVLIFGETKWGVQRLADSLSKEGIPAEAIHGNKSQPQRQRALQAFTRNAVKVLVATDVAARGLDIPNVSHVINFDQPSTYENYVHRIGRTGRGGKSGQALTFVGKL